MSIKSNSILRRLVSVVVMTLIVCMGLALIPANIVRADNQTGKVTNVTQFVNLRAKASTKSNVVKQVPLGTAISIEAMVPAESDDTSGYSTWYKVSCTVGGTSYSGYIANYFVKVDPLPSATPTPTAAPTAAPTATPTAAATTTPAATTTATPAATTTPVATTTPPPTSPTTLSYETELAKFPESYQTYLKDLHAKHPNWVFVADTAPKTWNEVLTLETRSGCSLIQNTSDDSWKSKATGQYDPQKKTYKVVDSPNWVNAHRATVAYYLDPRNNLTEETVFQFLDLNYSRSAIPDTADSYVAKVLDGTFMATSNGTYAGTTMSYSQLIALAGYSSSVNPIFLAARIVQEVGVSGSSSSDGKTGYYNFYNIGAYSDATNSAYVGLKFAQFGNGVENSEYNQKYMIPWKTQGDSIIGGGKWIGDNYVQKGQNTIYYMRFNVASNTATKVCYHQYMTATASPSSEATRMFNAYTKSGLADKSLVFVIPVYKDLPSAKAPLPTAANANTDYVNHIYNTLLGRAATADEISSMSTKLSNGTPAVNVVNDLINGKEFQDKKLGAEDQVKLFFKALMNRDADPEGLKYFTDFTKNGYSMNYVYTQMANSEEAQKFMCSYTINPGYFTYDDVIDKNIAYKPFVERLYTGFMGRAYDTEGLRSWISVLANKSQSGQQVLASFYKSKEFQGMTLTNEEFIKRLYTTCLGREAEADGLKFWLGELNDNKKSRDYVFAAFANSPEFNELCKANNITTSVYTAESATATPTPKPTATPTPTPVTLTYNETKGKEFVTRLYKLALDREPETDGLNYWTTELKNGTKNGREVAYGFIFSKELTDKKLTDEQFVDILYAIFFDRTPDTEGRAFWIAKLKEGNDRQYVFEGFVYSEEFVKMCVDAGIVPNASYKK